MNDKISHICLAHLSINNNTPEKALSTLHEIFSKRGIKLNGQPQIAVLNRNMPNEMIKLLE
jgi:hypothetical protein